MTKHERRQLELCLRSARTTRTHAHEALLAHQGDNAMAVRLSCIHAEACAIEADVHRALVQAIAADEREVA